MSSQQPINEMVGTESKITKKIINVQSSILRESIRALSGIAKNAMNESDRLINFMCLNNTLILTATDTSREAQIELEVNSNVTEVFSTNVDKLLAIMSEGGSTRIEVEDNYLLVMKEDNVIQLPKYKVNHKPYETNFVNDILDVNRFLKVLRIFSKYITSENDDSGVIIFSDNQAYVRNRLFYVMTEFPTKEHYIFDKTTCKNIITMITAFGNQGSKDIRIAKVGEHSQILLVVGNMSIKVPMLRHEKIDLKKFTEIRNANGLSVNRSDVVSVIKEIKEVENPGELDIIGKGSVLIVKPSSELTLTEYKIKAREMVIEENNRRGFTYTVNTSAFETLLKGVNTESTYLSASSDNMLMVLNKDVDCLIKYFISVF